MAGCGCGLCSSNSLRRRRQPSLAGRERGGSDLQISWPLIPSSSSGLVWLNLSLWSGEEGSGMLTKERGVL